MKLQFNAANLDGTPYSATFNFGEFGDVTVAEGIVETSNAACASALVATGNFVRIDSDVVAEVKPAQKKSKLA